MPGGFASPAILFLSTWDAPERSFCHDVFAALRERGYTRYVEPCAGGFAMPVIARAAGWRPEQMECSDVNLFSAVVGSTLSEGSPMPAEFAALGVRLDGELVELPDGVSRVEQGATLLWLQLLARMQARPDVAYWRALVGDLLDRKVEHVQAIARKLAGMHERLGGITFRAEDCWEHIRAVADDPHTVVSLNPPSYRSGFERFFDTGGRLSWNEPVYSIWDPDIDLYELSRFMEGRAALLIGQQQRVPGEASHKRPVFARDLSLGQYVYIVSNRPDEVFEITGGPKVMPRKTGEITPSNFPPLPLDHEVTDKSTVGLLAVKAPVADYYRGLWMHRLVAQPGSYNMLVVVDGYAAGILGYSIDTMARPYSSDSRWVRHLLLRFAFGAPHDTLRMTRLATMLAMQRGIADQALGPAGSVYLAASDGLMTVEMTRYPESKGMRGLMKLANKQEHPDGFKLTYAAPWSDLTPGEVLRSFLTKEERWRNQRAK